MELYNGDCLEMMRQIPDKSIDMVLCDMPYGITRNKWDIIIPLDKLWEQYNRIVKDNGAIVLFANQPFTTQLINSNKDDYKYNWIWIKNNPTNILNSHKQPLRCYEEICVFYKKQPTYNNINAKESYWKRNKPQNMSVYGKVNKTEFIGLEGCNRNILEFKNKQGSSKKRFHPTEKPTKLLEFLINVYTNENETVLDNCMGSGTTGIACELTNRNFIGIEIEKKYYDIAKQRIENYKKKIGE